MNSELKRKTVAAEEAAALVKSGNWIDYGFGIGQPDVFDQALAARIPQLTDVKIRGTLALRPRAVIEADPEGRHAATSRGISRASNARCTIANYAAISR